MSDVEKRRGPAADRIAGGLTGVGIGALASLALGPGVGALLVAAMEPLAEELSRSIRELAANKLTRVAAAASEAESFTGRAFGDLLARSLTKEDEAALLSAALQGAADVTNEQIARTLGRAYARGTIQSDRATIDLQRRLVTTIGALQPVDIRTLDRMASDHRGWVTRPLGGTDQPAVSDAVPGAEPVLDSVLAHLANLGLITEGSKGGISYGNIWTVTDFGRRCLSALSEFGQAGDGSSEHD